MRRFSLILLTAILAIGIAAASCSKMGKLTGPQDTATTTQTTTDTTATFQKPGATTAGLTWPAWYKELSVPWNTQFIPGATSLTKNCGQTCATMIDGYYRHYSPGSSAVVAVDRWLDGQFPGLGYATPNSYYTNIVAPRYALTKVIQNYYHYSSYPVQGATPDNLSRIFRAINAGYPVIACVEISSGNIVSYDAIDHWVVLVGFNQGNGGEVIMHNPGTSDSSVGGKGKFHHMKVADFMKSWSYAGGYWMPVTYPMSVYF